MEQVKLVKSDPISMKNPVPNDVSKKKNDIQFGVKKSTSELVAAIESAQLGSIHTIDDVIESSKRGLGDVEYNKVTLSVNNTYKTITVGVLNNDEDVITVPLTNGYRFSFNFKDADQVNSCLTLFSPEDKRRILQAISEHNYKKKKQAEIEQDKAFLGEAGDESKKAKEKKHIQKEDTLSGKMEDTFKRMRAGSTAAALFYQQKPEEIQAGKEKKELQNQQLQKEAELLKQENDKYQENQRNDEIEDALIQRLLQN